MSKDMVKEVRNVFSCPGKCPHYYQDKLYGEGKRVFTPTRKDNNKSTGKRCTVCKTTV